MIEAMSKIKISSGDVELLASLNESDTCRSIWEALPIQGSANIWGDEIYFSIPVSASGDSTATDVVDIGTVAYWPPGNALCLFWGPTPASRNDDEIRAASAVNICGKIESDASILTQIRSGSAIVIDRA